jgi:heme/copper-type cytochrome/quinol oxidase subunit 3
MDGALPAAGPAPFAAAGRAVVPSAVLGMLILVVTELMFFSGLLSALTISRANQLPGMWPPPGQPSLPTEATRANTAALLASGLLLATSAWQLRRGARSARWTYLGALLCGGAFLLLQGEAWASLRAEGLTLTSSTLGSFFHLLVGGHGLHAAVALAALGWGWVDLLRGRLAAGYFQGVQVLWYFLVLLWPVIYARLYA